MAFQTVKPADDTVPKVDAAATPGKAVRKKDAPKVATGKPLPTWDTSPTPPKNSRKKSPVVVERPGYGPFNLAYGAEVETLVTDWKEAISLLADEPILGLDLETVGMGDKDALSPWRGFITVVGLYGPRSKTAAVIHVPTGELPVGLLRFLDRPGAKYVTHNGTMFDILFLARAGMNVYDVEWYDSLIGEQVITLTNRRGVSKKLQDVVKRRLNFDIAKEVDHRDWMLPELTTQQVRYVAEDISFLPAIRESQYGKAAEVDQQYGPNWYGKTITDALELEHQLIPTVVRMQLRGLPVDESALQEYFLSQIADAAAAQKKLNDKFGETNWGSHVQIKKKFKAVHDIDLHSTAEDELKEVRDLFTGTDIADDISTLLIFKHSAKRAQTYNGSFVYKYTLDGWAHGNFSQVGTDTGRFSSSRPNLQQIPKNKGDQHGRGARHIFGNHPDFDIVAVDYSQIEFRVAVNEANDEAAIALLRNSTYDIHTLIASQVFGVEPLEVTRDQRQLSKAMSFTLLFGGGAALLSHYAKSQGAYLPLERSRPLVKNFFEQFQGLSDMRDQAYKIADSKRPFTIKLPTGLRRTLVPNIDLRATLILNNRVQGTAAAGLKYGLLEAQKEGLDEFLGAVVHDETVSAVPKKYSQEFGEKMAACMVRGMEKVCEIAPVAVEVSIGDTWG
jgi:DNA polymerase I-like protein with 3'-5' exonuclease and polymerase domains